MSWQVTRVPSPSSDEEGESQEEEEGRESRVRGMGKQ